MVALDRLPVVRVRQQCIVAPQVLERHVRRVAAVGVEHHLGRLGEDAGERDHVAEAHALPAVIVAAPGRHAVDVRGARDLRQGHELGPAQALLLLDKAEDAELPGFEIDARGRAVAEDRPAVGQALPRGQSLTPALGRTVQLAAGQLGRQGGPSPALGRPSSGRPQRAHRSGRPTGVTSEALRTAAASSDRME